MNGEYHLHYCELRLRMKRNDQMGNFSFPIVYFPFICSNIATSPAYWAYIFHLMWYSRICDSYHSFINRGLLLTRTLLNEGPLVVRWSHHFENFTVAIMNWFTITEYLCRKWLRIRSVCRNYNPTISSFMTYHRVINKSNTTDDTCGVGTAYHSAAHEFISDFSVVRVVRMLVLCVDLCFHCVVCPSLIYGFWLHLWYLQRFFVIDYITSIIYYLLVILVSTRHRCIKHLRVCYVSLSLLIRWLQV